MTSWTLFRQFSNPNKFRLLHGLYETPRTAGELAEKTGLTPSTVRSGLRSLRSAEFVD